MTYRSQLELLRSGPFRGQGGAAALAAALGVHPQTLKSWRLGLREPNYGNREKIAALWQEKCGGAS
jgi:transposase-like protein